MSGRINASQLPQVPWYEPMVGAGRFVTVPAPQPVQRLYYGAHTDFLMQGTWLTALETNPRRAFTVKELYKNSSLQSEMSEAEFAAKMKTMRISIGRLKLVLPFHSILGHGKYPTRYQWTS